MRWFMVGVVVLGVVAAAARAAEIHKWVDDAGVVHYGEAAPGNRESTTIETTDEPAAQGSDFTSEEQIENQNRVIQQLSEERERRQTEKEEADSKKQKHAGECNKLRGRIATLKDGGRIFWTKPDGQREYMSDAMRARKLAESEAQLKKHCK